MFRRRLGRIRATFARSGWKLRPPRIEGENFQSKIREVRMMEGDEIIDLRRWWLDRMLNGPAPLLEKMTLFWHGHFATSIQKVRDAYWMWLQNDTLRRNALGNFGALVKKMSRDPAMMIYLDLQQSRQEHPNENWARELMELFTVGIGNYTEQDIRESARAFTGYRIDYTTQQFRFAPFQQDPRPKTFMGRTGNLNGDEHYRHAGLQTRLRTIHRPQTVAIFRRRRTVDRSCRFGRRHNSQAQFRNAAAFARDFQFRGILFRSRDGHPNQKPGAIHRSNFETTERASAAANRSPKCDAADGSDSFCAAECERLGRRQRMDQHLDIVISL